MEAKEKENKKQRKRRRIAEFIQAEKNIPCVDCGVNRQGLMTYDHVKRSSKLFNISDGPAKTWTQVKQEILKCEVVCLSCHMKREEKRDAGKLNCAQRRKNKEYSLRFSMINELVCELNFLNGGF